MGDGVRLLIPEKVTCVVIHTTASKWGSLEAVTDWHKRMGFDTVGYHFLILNLFTNYNRWIHKQPDPWSDGKVVAGRSLDYEGAHVRYHNGYTVGIAMVGEEGQFTSKQLHSAVILCRDLKHRFPNMSSIKGHTELDPKKTCPDLDMDQFRFWVAGGWP